MKPEIRSTTYISFLPDEIVPAGYSQPFTVEVELGWPGEDSADIFTFEIATPKALSQSLFQNGVLVLMNLLVVADYSPETIERVILRVCDLAASDDWENCLEKLRKLGHWEFENYQAFVD